MRRSGGRPKSSTRLRFVLLGLSDHAERGLRIGIAIDAVVAVVLGILGWRHYDAGRPGGGLDTLTVIYRTVALFALDGSGSGSAPLTLELARFLAPLATAAATLTVLLSKAKDRLHRLASRHVKGHGVVVGSYDRARPYLDARDGRGQVVHAVGGTAPSTGGAATRTLSTTFDPLSSEWLKATGFDAAHTVILATGDDETNLRLLGHVISRLDETSARLDVKIEMDDRDAALWLTMALVTRYPSWEVETVCRPDLSARRMAAETVASAVPATGWGSGASVTVALSGQRAVVSLFVEHTIDLLRRAHQRSGAEHRMSLLIHGDYDTTRVIPQVAAQLSLTRFDSFDDLLAAGAGIDVAVVASSEGADRRALEFRSMLPSKSRVFLESRGPLPVDIQPLDLWGDFESKSLVGPFILAAREKHRHDEIGRRPIEAEEPPAAWDAAEVIVIRRSVAALVNEQKLKIGPKGPTSRRRLLTATQVGSFPASTEGERKALIFLPFWLFAAGLGFMEDRPTATTAAMAMPDDVAIEAIGQLRHNEYLANLPALNPKIASHAPWDRLPASERAQNLDQARSLLVVLARHGVSVAHRPVAPQHRITSIDVTLGLEEMAETEHNRWVELRYELGYHLDTKRNDLRDAKSIDGIAMRTHPDMLAWDDLDERTRDKDRSAIYELPARLASVGFYLIR